MPASLDLTKLNETLGAYCREFAPRWVSDMVLDTQASQIFEVLTGFQHEKPLIHITSPDLVKPYTPVFAPTEGLAFEPRILRLKTAKLELQFEPLAYLESYLGHAMRPQANSREIPFESFLMTKIREKATENIEFALVKGVHNAAGTGFLDIMDGILTIIIAEIAAGNLTEGNGRVVDLGAGAFSETNTFERLEALFEAVPSKHWMAPDWVLICSPEVLSFYNKNYLALHNNVPYNNAFNKTHLRGGTGSNVQLVALPGMAASERVILTQRRNLFLGMASDNMRMETQRVNWMIHLLSAFRVGVEFGTLEQVWVNKVA